MVHLKKRLGILAILVAVIAGGIGVYVMKHSAEPGIKEKYAALHSFFKKEIEREGGAMAYKDFVRDADKNKIDTHIQAHIFGEALYEAVGLPGIDVCDTSFRFGCYHSFFAEAISASGIGILPKLDDACRNTYGKNDTRCQHGIGHGLLVYTGYDHLLDALGLCATLDSQQPTGGCFGGAFMEYNFHTMEQMEGSDYTRDMTDDKFAPCDSLPGAYRPGCYTEQVHWWRIIYKDDFTYIGTLCSTLGKDLDSYKACFRSIGDHATELALFDTSKVIAACNLMPSQAGTQLCYEGSSWLMLGSPDKKDAYMKMCEVLHDEMKQACYDRADF